MAQIGETELDMRALSRALWRKAWLLALLAIAATVGTYIALGTVQPLYTADTSILIEQRESPLTRPDQGQDASVEFDESAIQSHVEVLRSRQIANSVIDSLDLIRRPDFDPATRPSLIDSLLVVLGVREHPAEATIRQRVTETYFQRLSVFPLAKSRVITVQFEAPDPELAAEVANAVASAFVTLQQEAKRESALAATDWLQQEIERLRVRVQEAERAVADYRARNELFTVDATGNLSNQQLSDLNAELARARAARAEAEARASLVASLIADGGSLESSAQVLDSALVQRLRERQVGLQAQIAELSTTLLPGHPRIQALEGQVANLESQIRAEAVKIERSLTTAARVAAAREQSIMGSLNEAKVAVNRSNGQEIELRALEREAASQRDLLESFLGRYREALARTDAGYLPADARIISRAVAAGEPSYPKKTMMAIATGLATLLIASALLVMREFTSGRAFRVVGAGLPLAVAPIFPSVVGAAPVVAPVRPTEAVVVAADPAVVAEALAIVAESPTTVPGAIVMPESLASASEAPSVVAGGPAAVDIPAPEHAVAVPVAAAVATELFDDGQEGLELSLVGLHPLAADAPGFDPAIEPELPFDEHAPAVAAPQMSPADRAGTAELAEIVANPAVRLALFAGAARGEGAGEIAYAVARHAARENLRFVLVDVGSVASAALGVSGEPGLGELLAGNFTFGEVIRRDEAAQVHVIPMGSLERDPPLQRLQLVVGALTHTYDKVVVVADSLQDWPAEHIKPDLAAIVCGANTTEAQRARVYESALERGARTAVIIRFGGDQDEHDRREESAAA